VVKFGEKRRYSASEHEAIYQELVEAGLNHEAMRDPDAIEAVYKNLNAADEAEAASHLRGGLRRREGTPALSPNIFKRPDGGSARSARPRLMEAIMVDRTAAAEITTLRQELAAAKARIQEMGDKDSAFKPFTSWKSRTPTLDDCVNAWLHFIPICRGRDPVEG
jgi:hypothetical protein